MQERLDAAVERVKSLMRQGYKAPYAIGIVANEKGLNKADIARAMSSRRWHKPKSAEQKPKPPTGYDLNMPELCRECGHPLERGDEICSLCGDDTSWIW